MQTYDSTIYSYHYYRYLAILFEFVTTFTHFQLVRFTLPVFCMRDSGITSLRKYGTKY